MLDGGSSHLVLCDYLLKNSSEGITAVMSCDHNEKVSSCQENWSKCESRSFPSRWGLVLPEGSGGGVPGSPGR